MQIEDHISIHVPIASLIWALCDHHESNVGVVSLTWTYVGAVWFLSVW